MYFCPLAAKSVSLLMHRRGKSTITPSIDNKQKSRICIQYILIYLLQKFQQMLMFLSNCCFKILHYKKFQFKTKGKPIACENTSFKKWLSNKYVTSIEKKMFSVKVYILFVEPYAPDVPSSPDKVRKRSLIESLNL